MTWKGRTGDVCNKKLQDLQWWRLAEDKNSGSNIETGNKHVETNMSATSVLVPPVIMWVHEVSINICIYLVM